MVVACLGCLAALGPAAAVAATPAIAIHVAPASIRLGGSFAGVAVLSGVSSPTGTITFRLFGPDDPSCSDAPVFSPPAVTVDGRSNETYESAAFTPSQVGTYRWRASYSGDATNPAPAMTACSDPAAAISVAPPMVTPTLTQQASASVSAGGEISDTATIANGNSPAGRITFMVFGPGDANCASPLATSNVAVAGNSSYASPAYTATVAGTYHWIASYSGDADNLPPLPTSCADPAGAVAVTQPPAAAADGPGGGLSLTLVAPGGSSSSSATSSAGAAGSGDGPGGLAFTPVLSRIFTGSKLFVRLRVPASGEARITYEALRGERILARKTTKTIHIKQSNQTSVTFHLTRTARTARVFRVSARYGGITVARTLVRKSV